MFQKGDELAYISGITQKGVKVHYSNILEISEDGVITLENAMVLKFVKKPDFGAIWLTYLNTKTGKNVLVQDKI